MLRSVIKATPFTGVFPDMGTPQLPSDRLDMQFKACMESAEAVMQGYEEDVPKVCGAGGAQGGGVWGRKGYLEKVPRPQATISQVVT